jgi:electron transport complex protein RnfB
VVGFFDDLIGTIDAALAQLYEEYFAETRGLSEAMAADPAINRVVPAQGSVKTEWILPYDDVRAVLMGARGFRVRECICRKQQELIDNRKCDYPLEMCLTFYASERQGSEGSISMERALAILDESERLGLVHTVSNVMNGVNYMCNCCGCCCGVLRGITNYGVTNSVAHANYYATVDDAGCTGCGMCEQRCQVGAVNIAEGTATVDRERCIGCGVCVSGCAFSSISLVLKPEDQIVHPPEDFGRWEQARKVNRAK